MEREPVLTLSASDPNAPALVRAMVDRRRNELLSIPRTDDVETELKQLSRFDDIADQMAEWLLIYGKGR